MNTNLWNGHLPLMGSWKCKSLWANDFKDSYAFVTAKTLLNVPFIWHHIFRSLNDESSHFRICIFFWNILLKDQSDYLGSLGKQNCLPLWLELDFQYDCKDRSSIQFEFFMWSLVNNLFSTEYEYLSKKSLGRKIMKLPFITGGISPGPIGPIPPSGPPIGNCNEKTKSYTQDNRMRFSHLRVTYHNKSRDFSAQTYKNIFHGMNMWKECPSDIHLIKSRCADKQSAIQPNCETCEWFLVNKDNKGNNERSFNMLAWQVNTMNNQYKEKHFKIGILTQLFSQQYLED